MNQKQRDIIRAGLQEFGAGLLANNRVVRPDGRASTVTVRVRRNRLQFIGAQMGTVLGEGPVDANTVTTFCRDFWQWEPLTTSSEATHDNV